MKFSYRIFKSDEETILGIADASLLGKVLKGRNVEIAVSDFYSGKKCDDKEVIKLIKKATIINAIGKEIVGLLLKNKIVDRSKILYIGDVPHAQIVSIM